MKYALVAMSGGVDSAVSALLTVKNGAKALGVTMKLFEKEENPATCGSLSDVSDARAIAASLGMEHETLDYSEAFAKDVMDDFVHSYEIGETPNPCLRCNATMKFGRLMAYAEEKGCDTLVTGHYARVEYDASSGKYLLKKAKCAAKDQSYVLYFLSQAQLSHLYFPLGEFNSKEEVRALAADHALINAKKHDSQDICFVPDGEYAAFICERTGKTYPGGLFLDTDGRPIGHHNGLIRYTVGQRKGLGVAMGVPMYVKEKSVENNTVTLSDDAGLFSDTCYVRNVCFTSGDMPKEAFRAQVKPRYKAKEAPATITPLPAGYARVVFDTPQRALTTGQAAVFYDGDVVLGGGIIDRVGK